ncbi:hypothetical protein [Nostoc sp. ChiVER01]|uniref:hypothetical protein n=1 Tax=Nostoc sp. ChiVER01 TaxID=3075382 RepID=UPI002AD2D683|nr:hypothetical protein [Nostoc sp. ChiVER01]MDZ8221408.1 hypothetical protein [Nostoc sp. ChiVER01]
MSITLVTASKDSCSMFKKGYKKVKIWDKKQKALYEQKDPRFIEGIGDLLLSVESKSNMIAISLFCISKIATA